MNMNTAVLRDQCTDSDACDPDQYEWKTVHSWNDAVWHPSKMVTAGIHWKSRQLETTNVWQKRVSLDSLYNLVHDAGYSMAAEAFKTEFMCLNEPTLGILDKVVCACGSGRSSSECDGVLSKPVISPVVTATLFAGGETRHLKTAVGSVSVSTDIVKASAKRGKDNVAVTLLVSPAFSHRDTSGSASDADRRVSAAASCSQFEIIKNSEGQVVGQLIGKRAMNTN